MNPAMISIARQASPPAGAPLGSVLVKLGKLQPEDVDRITVLQQQRNMRFGEAAQVLGLLTEADVRQALAQQFDYAYLEPGEGDYPIELVAAYQPFSAQVEVLRSVRSELLLRWFAPGRRSLAVASINPGDGASFFTANLALVFAQTGKRTLLIDANLRNPRQHRIFNLHDSLGLSDMLVRRADVEAVSQPEGCADLSVLSAGTMPPNPQELISHQRFGEVEQSLSSRHDVTLIDVPALSTGADALHVAARVGGVLLLIRRDHARMEQVQTAARQLARCGIEVVGSVLIDH
ncbi:chain length determinant protein tyrosine kinase EpsG [Lacisediminimonas sp.]|uniref:chain length determinant protein tyrosine kinase EpsG n=1 Tax=Lacisediminimonas sp. TaxID=3060582 RepID=UPI00271B6AE8|nr:chain length determinant protein tyrosine kinase EpsG [Lacisediminimonas sp.]MDO8300769.1 chain length determinant protein tyrosine kinase EpsG [Lacisediminimonas sp.]